MTPLPMTMEQTIERFAASVSTWSTEDKLWAKNALLESSQAYADKRLLAMPCSGRVN